MPTIGNLDTRNLNPDETVSVSGYDYVWVAAEVEEKVYFLNPAEGDTIPAGVIKFSEPCLVAKASGEQDLHTGIFGVLSLLGVAITGVYDPADSQSYGVSSVTVTNPGGGYTNATINFSGGGGSGAAAQAVLSGPPSGAVVSVVITNAGTGYTSAPNVSITGNGSGATLAAKATIGKIPKAYCGIPVGSGIKDANLNVDVNASNNLGYYPQYAAPSSAVIPIRSNIRTYGPYISANFTTDYGGIEAETDPDIAPWVFGSIAAANIAGNARANEFPVTPLKISETGSASIIGFPSLSFGKQLGGNGPYINSMNMSFGPDGVKTILDFQTFTPKFGSIQNVYRNQIKNSIKNRQKQLQFLRNQTVISQKINRNIGRIKKGSNSTNIPRVSQNPANGGTLQRLLVGEIYDWQKLKVIEEKRSVQASGQRIVTGFDHIDSVQEYRYNYKEKAYISLDGIYSPVSISGGLPIGTSGNVLPRYVIPSSGSGFYHQASTLYAQPPFFTGSCETPNSSGSGHNHYNLEIHNLYLNPLANPTGIPHFTGTCAGHNIDIVGRGTGIPESGMDMSLYTEDEIASKYYEDYRFLGMRGPIVLHSWGYDTDGKPIPNYIDDEIKAKSGIYVTSKTGTEEPQTTGLMDYFMQDWLQKPATWPVGPIDLRFDRERGVWVSPPAYKIVVAKIVETVPAFGSGIGNLINVKGSERYGKKLFTKFGIPVVESGCPEEPEEPQEPTPVEWVLTSIGSPSGENCGDTFDIVTCIELQSDKLVATKSKIKIPGAVVIQSGLEDCYVPVQDCPTTPPPPSPSPPPPSEPPTETPTPTPTQSNTPTPTPSISPTPTPTPTVSVSESGNPFIKIVDRIGLAHPSGDLVYAYYETYDSEYIVLGSMGSGDTIYGIVTPSGSGVNIYVEGATAIDEEVYLGANIYADNPVNFIIPSGTSCYVRGVATRFPERMFT